MIVGSGNIACYQPKTIQYYINVNKKFNGALSSLHVRDFIGCFQIMHPMLFLLHLIPNYFINYSKTKWKSKKCKTGKLPTRLTINNSLIRAFASVSRLLQDKSPLRWPVKKLTPFIKVCPYWTTIYNRRSDSLTVWGMGNVLASLSRIHKEL